MGGFAKLGWCWGLVWLVALGAPRVSASEFGTSEGSEAALIGILYDLKQTQQGEPSGVTEESYAAEIGEFLNGEWDENLLNQYFRVSRPVYATRIFIRTLAADQAPKAFGVDDVVEPRLWLVHYKGQVEAPLDGVYRLAGFADDFMAARVNGETVLVCGRPDSLPEEFFWEPSSPDGLTVGNGKVRYGNWFAVQKGEVIDLDVLVGERPGGIFSAWLYIQRKGEKYPMNVQDPVLPPFQLSDVPVQDSDVKFAPPRPSSVWRALQ
ncbi:MAG: hypothetical protein ACQKBT_01155 [Puniceicoccales bacterium]